MSTDKVINDLIGICTSLGIQPYEREIKLAKWWANKLMPNVSATRVYDLVSSMKRMAKEID